MGGKRTFAAEGQSASNAAPMVTAMIATKTAHAFNMRLVAPGLLLHWWRTAMTHTGIARATPMTMVQSLRVILLN